LVRGFLVADLVFFGATCAGFAAVGDESAESAMSINTPLATQRVTNSCSLLASALQSN